MSDTLQPKKTIKWHELIGLGLIDLFTDSNFKVKTEQDSVSKAPICRRADYLEINRQTS